MYSVGNGNGSVRIGQTSGVSSVNDAQSNEGPIVFGKVEKDATLYKCSKFENFDMASAKEGCDTKGEWAGQYFAYNKDVSEGYANDYLNDKGAGTVYMHEFKVTNELKSLETSGDYFAGGSSGDVKSGVIKDFLHENSESINGQELIKGLDDKGMVYVGPCDKEVGDRREVVFGKNMLDNLEWVEKTSVDYKDYSKIE